MLEHKRIQSLSDYFIELNSRTNKGVYFYRINGYSNEIDEFIRKYYSLAIKNGVVIEGKIQNPDKKNLEYYNEIMGLDFQLSIEFIFKSLKKWLPRMNDFQRKNIAQSIFYSLDSMRKNGKTESMVKNAYIKFMCWLYYKFERVLNQLGNNNIPKILYEGEITKYELMLISILSNAGCDVILLQYRGDKEYLKIDKSSYFSYELDISNLQPFPNEYSIKKIRDEIQNVGNIEKIYGYKPKIKNCTNEWIKDKSIDEILKKVTLRGEDKSFFYNCFFRINGVEDKITYENKLFKLQQEIRSANRKLVIVNEKIPKPTLNEIDEIKRGNYSKVEQLILDLSKNINRYSENIELQKIIRKAFVDIILLESKENGENINKLKNKAVYLLCWLNRYMSRLFSNWKISDIGCFIHMGGCKDKNEALFIKFLARLPVDVLILCPNLNETCCLKDKLLYEVSYDESLSIKSYPEENYNAKIGTVAYHAEKELDKLLYSDSGIYRNQQYSKANIISLRTMYEEIRILWNQEIKYRPNFSVADNVVNIPVIFSKISGVKDGLINQYWKSINELITDNTFLIQDAPYIKPTDLNPMKPFSVEFIKNGKIQRNKIKNHKKYQYGILREEMQDFILEKLQLLLDQKLINGIGENGTEYTVVAQILNLPKEIIRMIQNFDFTKKNPKLIYINTSENTISLEDSILIIFLNLIGFDVLFFVPTGYQCMEKYLKSNLFEEHQIGEYKYDINIPNLKKFSSKDTHYTWYHKIFKRGN